MSDEYKSVFGNEIYLHILLRKEELGSEAFRHYKRTVMLFDDYLCRINYAKEEIDEPTIEQWIKEISIGTSRNTASQYVHCVRQLLFYLVGCGYPCFIPKTIQTQDKYIPYLYTNGDIEAIFAVTDSLMISHVFKNTYINKEMPLFLRLLYCCGMRVSEALSIKVGDIDFDRNLIILRVTKKYKQRIVPYEDKLAEILYLYCIAMGILNDTEAYLFHEKDKYIQVSASSIGTYYRIIRKTAGIRTKNEKKNERGACLHCFRHTFAVRSFDKNERDGIKSRDSVPFLSTYLGHDSLYETEKYLKYGGDFFEDTLTKFESYAGTLFPEVDFDE